MAGDRPSPWSRLLAFPAVRVPSKRTLYSLFLLILLAFYWVFVWQMERIDLEQYQLPVQLPLPQFLVTLSTFFLPRVLRHFVPLILGWLLAFEIAANLLFYLYDLPDRADARGFLMRLRSPRRFRGATVKVTPQTLERQREESPRVRAGGPGRFNIPIGHVAVTEQNGRYARNIDAGTHLLDNFEHIHAVLDLRPQHRGKEDVRLQSKEGLEVTTDVSATFRISTGGSPVTQQEPFPFDADAVRKLAYSQVNLPNHKTGSWEGTALGAVIGILRKTVATFTLDELLQDAETELGAHLTIRSQVEREAREKLREQGIELQRVRIGRFSFPEAVTNQHIAYWTAYWEREAEMAKTDGAASALEELEIARAEAELEMIKAIVKGMQQAQQQGHGGVESVVVALRLIEALQRLAVRSQEEVAVPSTTLQQLQVLHQQLQAAGIADGDTVNERLLVARNREAEASSPTGTSQSEDV